MADRLLTKMARWGLLEIGVGMSYGMGGSDGPVIAWTGEASRKGYVMFYPLDPAAIWAENEDAALEKLSVLAL